MFNFFIILLITSVFVKYKIVNTDYINNNFFYNLIQKITSIFYINNNNRLLLNKLLLLFIFKNCFLYSFIKKSIYINEFLFIWCLHDILSFFVSIISIIFITNIFNDNIFNIFNNNKILKIVNYYISSKNSLYTYMLKIILLFIFIKICFFIVNMIPHIIY